MFGIRQILNQVGQYLAQHKVFLSPITAPISVPYINPHASLFQSEFGSGMIQTGQGVRSADEVKSQIDSIYNNLTSAENLPEMETGTLVTLCVIRLTF